MRDEGELRATLHRIDGRGYKAYRDLADGYLVDGVELHIDHVQGDPFAAPSRLRVRVRAAEAGWEPDLSSTRVRRIALEDHLARRFARALGAGRAAAGSGRSGVVAIDAGRQEVLERSAAVVAEEFVELRISAGLPAAGRRILGREAEALLCTAIPRAARAALCADGAALQAARVAVSVVENQEAARAALAGLGLVALVADGAVLPRASGATDRPLAAGAVPFSSPDALRVAIPVPHPVAPATPRPGGGGQLEGLGVPEGVTLIVGGGYHGKSTLLRALERSVHPHVAGDGREGVVVRGDAVVIRAEDGRRVEASDISGFIGELPQGRSPASFRSDDASGSTSQAANIVEALEAGSHLLLLDEDTSATNFMVRDARMQALVAAQHEPITPFVDRVQRLYREHGVSTVLVMGGCGDYFEVADTVIEMRAFEPRVVTAEARRIAEQMPSARRREGRDTLPLGGPRFPERRSIDPARGRREVKLDVRGTDELGFGRERIDLRAVEQLLDPSQTRAIGHALVYAREHLLPGRSVAEILDALDALLDAAGPDALALGPGTGGRHPGDLARPRRFEIAAALNRLRGLSIRAAP